MLFSALLQLPTPLLTRYLIDVIVPAGDLLLLNLFSLVLIGLIVLLNFISYTQRRFLIVYRNKVDQNLREKVFSKFFTFNFQLFEKERIGYWESRLDNDVNRVQRLFYETALDIIINFLTFIVGVGLLLYLNYRLALISFILLPVFIITFHLFSRKIHHLSQENQEAWAQLNGRSVEYLGQNLPVRVFGRVKRVLELYQKVLSAAIQKAQKLELYSEVSSIVIGLVAAVIPLFVLWYGMREIIIGSFTLGGFIAFNSCIGYLYNPVRSLVGLNIDIHSAVASAERIFEIMDGPDEDVQFGDIELKEINQIEFSKVSFDYDERGRGIRDVSFVLNRSEKIRISGLTGSGKSTILKLLIGLYRVTDGKILINGQNIYEYRLESLRQRIGYVGQEAELLSGTIEENIVFFEKNVDVALLDEVVTICELKSIEGRFINGFKTDLLEGGEGISGGERQRIALARALYRRPDLLLLDESSSALDIKTEQKIFEKLMRLSWKPAIIFVTHRQQNEKYFDKVLEIGPH